jgi:hypothetical protein
MSASLSEKQLNAFHNAATSLKLYSRAELSDEKNRALIEKLYVDPLPNEQCFKTLIAENTTILIGRKGTGKSTIFQRVQHEIQKNKSNTISSYMDIRNVFEVSQVDNSMLERIEAEKSALPPVFLEKILLHNGFIRALISGIRDDLRKQVDQSILTKLRDVVQGTSAELFAGLDALVERLSKSDFENIVGIATRNVALNEKNSGRSASRINVDGSVSAAGIGGSVKVEGSNDFFAENASEEKFAQIMMRFIDTNNIIAELKGVLDSVRIKYLYVFLDDFSELPEEAMRVLVDSLVSPMVRWSDFIKFKIAAYPGRIYLGSIDNTKIEEVNLDLFSLYGASDVGSMEDKAIDFTKRIIERRIYHFCKINPQDYFDITNKDLWRVFFYGSVANPRILGHLLLYAYQSHLLYGKKIGVRAIQDAAKKYFEEKVMPFFSMGRYHLAFHERASIYSLKELLEKIVVRARELRNYKDSESTKRVEGRTPSSHFYVSVEFDNVLTSLELAFFITKYFEQSDRDGKKVSIYALNYGLCEQYQMSFGRPSATREHRLYFVERIFDYNPIMMRYISENQEIKCGNFECKSVFDISILPALRMLEMNCPKCKVGICQVYNLSRRYRDVIDSVRPELLLPDTELGIMQTLHVEGRPMYASQIATDLDCSGQLVGRRARNLMEKDLVIREKVGPVHQYQLTDGARSAYFSDPSADEFKLCE